MKGADAFYGLGLSLLLMLAGCGDKKSEEALAPESASLEAPKPQAMARKFEIQSSKVDFLMEAPLENIHGRAPDSMQGELYVDLKDLTKSTGLVKIDLIELEVLQSKREELGDEFSEETKNETQNQHMRTWLQISEDAPEQVREANRWVEFKIAKVSDVSTKDVLAMSGAERKVTAMVSGDFRLHGRKTSKSAKVELTFSFEGDEPKSLRVRTLEPVPVGLAEHDVHPRSAFDKLAQKTLAALGQKVAESAPVVFEFAAAPVSN